MNSNTERFKFKDTSIIAMPDAVFVLSQTWDYLHRHSVAEDASEVFMLHSFKQQNKCKNMIKTTHNVLDMDFQSHDLPKILLDSSSYSHEKLTKPSKSGRDLLNDMEMFCTSIGQSNCALWKHMFDNNGKRLKHLDHKSFAEWCEKLECNDETVACGILSKRQLYDYFNVAMQLCGPLDTFKFLQQEGIEPSTEQQYNSGIICSSLQKAFEGKKVQLHVGESSSIIGVSYFFELRDGCFYPSDANKPDSPALPSNVYYLPKSSISRIGKGIIVVCGATWQTGFLTRLGHWIAWGKKYEFGLFKSKCGKCFITSREGFLSVDSQNNQLTFAGKGSDLRKRHLQFEVDEETGIISYQGHKTWYSFKPPSPLARSFVKTSYEKTKHINKPCLDFNLIFQFA